MPVTMALQLIGTIAPAGCGRWAVPVCGLRGTGLLLLISTRVVRRMNQQEQQLKRQQDERNGILAEYIKKLRLVRQNGFGPSSPGRPTPKRQQELGCWAGAQAIDAINEGLMLEHSCW